MRAQERIMREAGYITAIEAMQWAGLDNVGTVHRMAAAGKVQFARSGRSWFIKTSSLLDYYKDNPVIRLRIEQMMKQPAGTAAPIPHLNGTNGKKRRR